MTDTLTSLFISEKPRLAAERLADFPAGEVALFLAELPDEVAAPLVARFSSRQMIEVLAEMPPGKIAGYLAKASPDVAASLLAHIPAMDYPLILDAADADFRQRLSDLLGISGQTIGMQTTNNFVRVSPAQTCADVRSMIESTGMDEDAIIVVVDDKAVYQGLLPITRIISMSNARRAVGELVAHVEPLRGDASVDSIITLQDWMTYPSLPVVDGSRRLLGTVTGRDLKRNLSRTLAPYGAGNPLMRVFDGYLNFCAELFEYLFAERRR